MAIYLTDDAFSVKAKHFNKVFTSILALFFLLRIANKSHFYAATALFFHLFWENDSIEEKGQNENEDIQLANSTNKNQEHDSLFKRLQTHIEHSTNSTPAQLETFVDDRSQVSQFQTVIKQEMSY